MKDKVQIELSVSDAQGLVADLILFKNTANGVNDIPDNVISAVEATGVLDSPETQTYLKLLEHATLDVHLTQIRDEVAQVKTCLLAMSGLDNDNEELQRQALSDLDRIFR